MSVLSTQSKIQLSHKQLNLVLVILQAYLWPIYFK